MPVISVMKKCGNCCEYKIIYYLRDRWGNVREVCVEHDAKLDSHQAWNFDKRPMLVQFPQDRVLS